MIEIKNLNDSELITLYSDIIKELKVETRKNSIKYTLSVTVD